MLDSAACAQVTLDAQLGIGGHDSDMKPAVSHAPTVGSKIGSPPVAASRSTSISAIVLAGPALPQPTASAR